MLLEVNSLDRNVIDCLNLILKSELVCFQECLGEDVLRMSTDEIVSRARLLDNEIKIMKSELMRISHELQAQNEKIKENTEKIKVNKTLPYLVSNVIEVFIVFFLFSNVAAVSVKCHQVNFPTLWRFLPSPLWLYLLDSKGFDNMLLLHVSLWHYQIEIGSVLVGNCLEGLKCYVLLFFYCH